MILVVSGSAHTIRQAGRTECHCSTVLSLYETKFVSCVWSENKGNFFFWHKEKSILNINVYCRYKDQNGLTYNIIIGPQT